MVIHAVIWAKLRLQPGDVVILDNLASHKSSKAEAILKRRGAWFLFLPPSSPSFRARA